MSASEDRLFNDDQMRHEANHRGCLVVEPAEDEIQLDIDQDLEEARPRINGALELINDHAGETKLALTWLRHYKSIGGVHYHVILKANRPLLSLERLTLQAIFGSDWRREVMCLLRTLAHTERPPVVLFEPVTTKGGENNG